MTYDELMEMPIEELYAYLQRERPEIIAELNAEHDRARDEEIARLREEIAWHQGRLAGLAEAAAFGPSLLDRACKPSQNGFHTN